MEGSEVLIHKEGAHLVLTPVHRHGLAELLASWAPLDDDFLPVEDPPIQERDPL